MYNPKPPYNPTPPALHPNPTQPCPHTLHSETALLCCCAAVLLVCCIMLYCVVRCCVVRCCVVHCCVVRCCVVRCCVVLCCVVRCCVVLCCVVLCCCCALSRAVLSFEFFGGKSVCCAVCPKGRDPVHRRGGCRGGRRKRGAGPRTRHPARPDQPDTLHA